MDCPRSLETVAGSVKFPVVETVLEIRPVSKGGLVLRLTGKSRGQKECYYCYALVHIQTSAGILRPCLAGVAAEDTSCGDCAKILNYFVISHPLWKS